MDLKLSPSGYFELLVQNSGIFETHLITTVSWSLDWLMAMKQEVKTQYVIDNETGSC